MGFEIAINNCFCQDGKKVVNSAKAAYLYADKVRVYDLLFSEDDIEKLKYLDEEWNGTRHSSQKETMDARHRFGGTLNFDTIRLDNVDVFLGGNRRVYITLHEHAVLTESQFLHKMIEFYSEIESDRHYGNINYSDKKYKRDLAKLNIECRVPVIPFENGIIKINQPYLDYLFKHFFDDSGFKLVNCPVLFNGEYGLSFESAPVYLSDYAFSSLPLFEEATADEIIDIRKELDKYVIPYRSAVLKMTQNMKEIPITDSFQRDCAYLYLQEIEPKVAAINEAIRDNNVFKNIAKRILTNKETWASVGALVAAYATTGELTNAISIGTAAAFGGLSIAEGIYKVLEEKKKIEESEMYFLYQAGIRLRRSKLGINYR